MGDSELLLRESLRALFFKRVPCCPVRLSEPGRNKIWHDTASSRKLRFFFCKAHLPRKKQEPPMMPQSRCVVEACAYGWGGCRAG